MTVFLFAAACFVVVVVAVGLLRVLYGPDQAGRLMSAQLVGSGGVAVLLILSAATETSPVVDVALPAAPPSRPDLKHRSAALTNLWPATAFSLSGTMSKSCQRRFSRPSHRDGGTCR